MIPDLLWGKETRHAQWSTDFSLAKETKIAEKQLLVIRMDSTNIFNHPTWFGATLRFQAGTS
jgi:hypothetical protein